MHVCMYIFYRNIDIIWYITFQKSYTKINLITTILLSCYVLETNQTS